jgi:hypothetical protein
LKTTWIGVLGVIEPEVTATTARGSGGGRGLTREQDNGSVINTEKNKEKAIVPAAGPKSFAFINASETSIPKDRENNKAGEIL